MAYLAPLEIETTAKPGSLALTREVAMEDPTQPNPLSDGRRSGAWRWVVSI